MKNWTYEGLIKEGYTVENVRITGADLKIDDHDSLLINIDISGNGWRSTYGNCSLGTGSYDYDYTESWIYREEPGSIEMIMRILRVLDANALSELKGKYARVARKGSDIIKIIGNIINDEWFDIRSYYEDKASENKLLFK